MTVAYVPVYELKIRHFRSFLHSRGYDISHYSDEQVSELLMACAKFFDVIAPAQPLTERLRERVQV